MRVEAAVLRCYLTVRVAHPGKGVIGASYTADLKYAANPSILRVLKKMLKKCCSAFWPLSRADIKVFNFLMF